MHLSPRCKPDLPPAPEPTQGQHFTVEKDLRSWLENIPDVVTVIKKPVSVEQFGALPPQSEGPIVFENIIEKPGYRMVDMLLKTATYRPAPLASAEGNFLKTRSHRLRQPPRGIID